MLKICQNSIHVNQSSFFLSPADVNAYIEGTITGPSTTPCSYIIEAQGRTYHCNRQHIRPIHIDTTPIPRPSAHQGDPISGPSVQHSPISGTSFHQNIPAKPPKPSCIPTQKCPASSHCSPTTGHHIKNYQKPTSHIPTSQSKLISRPLACLSNPTPQNKYTGTIQRPCSIIHNNPTITRPSYSPDEVINTLTHLIAMNGHPAFTEVRDKQHTEA